MSNDECRIKEFYHFSFLKNGAKRFNTSTFEIPCSIFDISPIAQPVTLNSYPVTRISQPVTRNPQHEFRQPIISPFTQTPCRRLRLSGRHDGSPLTAIKVAGIPGTSKPRSLIPSSWAPLKVAQRTVSSIENPAFMLIHPAPGQSIFRIDPIYARPDRRS